MQESTVRQIVEKIDTALGPDARASHVEKIAADILTDLSIATAGTTGDRVNPDSPGPTEWIVPNRVSAHLSLSDCTSRLSATVLAKTYDKIRRLGGSLPPIARRTLEQAGVNVPPVSLVLHGTEDLLLGYRKSDMLEIVSTIEQSATDAGFEAIDLLCISLEKDGSRTDLLDILPELLKSTSRTRVRIRIGSSATGVRAVEILSTAQTLFSTETCSDTIGPRVALCCNTRGMGPGENLIGGTGDQVRVDLNLSIWPLLDSVRSDLPVDACYGDRTALLASVGRRLAVAGTDLLDSMADLLGPGNIPGAGGVLSLSLNAQGEGPTSAGIWAGFPVSPAVDDSASRASALFLREGLLSDIENKMTVRVISDGLPLTYSLRNIRAVSTQMTPPDLAGYLVEIFAPAIKDGHTRWLSIVGSESAARDSSVQIPGVSGSVPLVDRKTGWKSEHFSCGGSILPSTRQNV